MKTLIIAEKPSVAKAIAEFLAKKNGTQASRSKSHYDVGDYFVTNLVGHVLANAAPHDYDPALEKWYDSRHKLPFVPTIWKLIPTKAELVSNVKSLLGKCDRVLHAGDPDNEGQLLVDELLLYLGNKKPVDRLWLNAVDDGSIAKAFGAIKSNKDYIGEYESALSRSHGDWLYGINITRIASIAGNGRFERADGSSGPINIGRVQTPTLALVVNRELEIGNFKPKDFYVPFIMALQDGAKSSFKAEFEPGARDEMHLDPDGRLISKLHADNIVQQAGKAGVAKVISYQKKNTKENPPMPYSLSSLQADMSKRFGFGVKKTLDLAQELYELKITSYPRVNCEYIPESQLSDAPLILKCIAGLGQDSLGAVSGTNKSLKSKSWDDAKTTAHHAIVPRPFSASDVAKLNPDQRKVFEAICQRYVYLFYPPATAEETEVVLGVAGDKYIATGKCYVDRAWKDAYASSAKPDKDTSLPVMTVGETMAIKEAGVDSKTTTAPSRFTEGTLISAMKNIHQYVSDPEAKKALKEGLGIGTEATRANMIEELLKKGYLSKKGGSLIPSSFSMELIPSLPKEMTSPEVTAAWQQQMSNIMDRSSSYDKFIANLEVWVRKLSKEVPDEFSRRPVLSGRGDGQRTPVPSVTIDGLTQGDCCPQCKKAELVGRIVKAEGPNKGTIFLSCSAGKGVCDFALFPPRKQQEAKKPLVIGNNKEGDCCPDCKKGQLQARTVTKEGPNKGKAFLGCSDWKEGCKFLEFDNSQSAKSRDTKPKTSRRSTPGVPRARTGAPGVPRIPH